MLRLTRIWHFILIAILAIVLGGCKSSDDSFGFAGEGSGNEQQEGPVDILSGTPTSNPVVVTAGSTETFAVTIDAGAGGSVSYVWKLDGATVATTTTSYYGLDGTTVPAGLHTFVVEASNSVSSDTYTWNVRKNNPPTIDSTTPAAGGNTVSCGGGTLNLQGVASDLDSDALSFTWKFNGALAPLYFTITTIANTSDAIFAPGCTVTGAGTISLEVSDGKDTDSYVWGVTVNNPLVASIDSYNPSNSPVKVPSTGSQAFSVSASGKLPLVYSWLRNGVTIGGESSAIYTFLASGHAVGTYTIRARVDDSDSFDQHDFTVIRNGPPSLSSLSPSASTKLMNYQSTAIFSAQVSDPNSDAMTFTWKLDGSTSASLVGTTIAGGTQATYSPTVSHVGVHTITLEASDGTETTSNSWTVTVNHFSEPCNSLIPGRVCTIVGRTGIGSGSLVASASEEVSLRPYAVIEDSLGNLFVSDDMNHVVWYHNRTAGIVSAMGTNVAPGAISVVIGNGGNGISADASSGTSFKLSSPRGMAWDSTNEALFIVDAGNHRVVRVNFADGVGRRVACTGTTTNNAGSNTNGALATTHNCDNPFDVAYDNTNKQLFVSSYNAHTIKRFDATDPDPDNWVGYVTVGRAGAATTSGTEDNVIGEGGSAVAARTTNPTALALDNSGNLYFVAHSDCRLRVVKRAATPANYFNGGVAGPAVGNVGTLVGATACSYVQSDGTAGGTNYSVVRFNNPRSLSIHQSGATVYGFFVGSWSSHSFHFVNNTGATTFSFGNNTIPPLDGVKVLGSGAAAWNGESNTGLLTEIYNPLMSTIDSSGKLVWADYNNFRVRSMDLSVANGAIDDIAGGLLKYGNSGDSAKSAPDVVMNSPGSAAYDATNHALVIADRSNTRLKRLDLTTGVVTTYVGSTSGDADTENANPLTQTYLRSPRGMFFLNGILVYADQANSNCMVRGYNTNGSVSSLWNRSLNPAKVHTLAGYVTACNTFTGSGGQATSARLHNLEGITTDGTNLYIANYSQHCIHKVTPAGVITTFLGLCSTAGNVDGVIGAASIRLRYPAAMFQDPRHPENFFFTDNTDQSTSRIKYVNNLGTSVTIGSTTISPGNVGSLSVTNGYNWGVAAYGAQVCFASGYINNATLGSHNVTCFNRDDNLQNTTMRLGPGDGSSLKGGVQLAGEQEGQPPTAANLNAPSGMAFDNDGNLYVVETLNHVVRMVKKWF